MVAVLCALVITSATLLLCCAFLLFRCNIVDGTFQMLSNARFLCEISVFTALCAAHRRPRYYTLFANSLATVVQLFALVLNLKTTNFEAKPNSQGLHKILISRRRQ